MSILRLSSYGLCLFACSNLLAPVAHAQAVAVAQVEGQVLDASGARVPNAEVKITDTDKGVTHAAISDKDGHYVLANLAAGNYKIEASAPGFEGFIQTGIVLDVGQNIQANVTLKVGAVTSQIVVAGDASMVETRETTVSNVMDGGRVLDLPLNGRQATDLILLAGAAVTAPGGDQTGSKAFYSSVTISIAGGQSSGTNYMLDGAEYTDTFSNINLPFPFPDALQEFSVETSTLPARNGMHPGGVVNVVTKSGSNDYHGDLFEFLRNEDLNARNYFVTAARDTLKRNQYGGTLGGKIVKNRLFFFGGYQGTRVRQDPPLTTSYIPTPATLAGNFSAFDGPSCISSGKSKQLIDPSAGGAPFPNDQIPVNRFNSASLKLIPYLPEDLIQNACGKAVYGVPNNTNEAQYVTRVDYVLSPKHTLFGRYLDDDYLLPPNWSAANILVTSSPGNAERAQTATIGETYIHSPTFVNSAHFSFSRRRDNRGPNSQDIDPTALGVLINPYTPSNFLQMGITGYFTVGCGTCGPGFFNSNSFQFADDVDIIRGKHQIAFGIDMIRTQNNLSSYHNADGNFTFSGTGATSTGDAMTDFELGILGASGFTFSKAQLQALRETIPGLYVQDTYRVSPHVTISAGLRWEPMLFPKDIYGRGSIFSMSAYLAGQTSSVFSNAPAGSFYYGDPGVNKAFTNDKWTNFAPRLGLVWNPHGDGKQTLRVGAAVLYDSSQVYYSERVMTNPPFVDDTTLVTPGPFNNPWLGYPGGDPFPIPSPPPKNVVFPTSAAYVVLPQHLKTMYMADWNLSYQRQFSGNWLVTASYLGNKTSHLWLGLNLDYDIYIPGQSTTANATQRSILYILNPKQGAYYSSLTQTDDGANADYNALLVSAQHRVSQHFSVLANFTWSHCISDGDFGGDIAGASYQIPTNRDADRGNCNFDYRRLMNASIVAESPFKGNNLTGHILGGWQVSPSLQLQSGGPLSITSGVNNSLTGGSGDRADPAAGVSPYEASWGPQLQMLNPSAFTQNPIGAYGTLGRDTIRGPGNITMNAALVRFLRFTERYRLETRFEAFNAINRVNFSSPATSLTSSTFGRITAAGPARVLQVAMKLHF